MFLLSSSISGSKKHLRHLDKLGLKNQFKVIAPDLDWVIFNSIFTIYDVNKKY